MTEPADYEAPSITPIGTLHELTLQCKSSGRADGILLSPGNVPIGDVSC